MSAHTTTLDASATSATPSAADQKPHGFLLPIVGGAAFAHLLNDLIQATLPSIFPLLKLNYSLSFGQIGLMALVYQVTASLLQPWIGLYTDKHPKPYLLPAGMVMTLIGIALPVLPPTWKVDCAVPKRPPEARRAIREASGWKVAEPTPTTAAASNSMG